MPKFIATLIFGLLTQIAVAGPEEYESIIENSQVLLPHNPTYFLPFSYNANPYRDPYNSIVQPEQIAERGDVVEKLEAEFQISFKTLTNRDIFGTGIDTFIAYTHQSWWQVYNASWSRPFRETNYQPEIILRKTFGDEATKRKKPTLIDLATYTNPTAESKKFRAAGIDSF